MLLRPVLRADTRPVAIPGEGVVLLGDDEDHVLPGAVYEALLPMLDGRSTVDEIAARLGRDRLPAEVYFALARLEEAGLVHEPAHGQPSHAGASGVRVLAVSGLDGVDVVLCGSYLDPSLAQLNHSALSSGRGWLLARRSARGWWLGPLLRPGVTACWRCLEHRLARNRPFEAGAPEREPGSPGAAGEDIAAVVSSVPPRELEGVILVLDSGGKVVRREPVRRRPQCVDCGDPSLVARLADGPPAGPSTAPAAWPGLVSPLTGVVHDVRMLGESSGPVHVAVARYGAGTVNPAGAPLAERGLRRASGRGSTPRDARTSAIGEAAERYSAVFQGDEPRLAATLSELGGDAIEPNLCMQFSEAQYQNRVAWNARASKRNRVPRPFDPRERLEWTPLRSLRDGARRWLPTMLLYDGYACDDPPCRYDPSGTAAGTTAGDAARRALLELIERDSLAIWWYNRITRPAVDLDPLRDGTAGAVVDELSRVGRSVWVLDITTDLGVPSFAALSRRTDPGAGERIVFGFGADPDPATGITRALTEMRQVLHHAEDAERAGRELEPAWAAWLREATVANQPHVMPAAFKSDILRRPGPRSADPDQDLATLVAILVDHHLEPFVLDQTRPDIEVPVARVVVPGLRHFRARFAPGRLYEVPVRLEWRDAAAPESSLNPVGFFL